MMADFHIHSRFSDGDAAPEEIVKRAIGLGLEALAVVDHVNAASDWIPQFSEEMRRLKDVYRGQIVVLSGLEAKCRDLHGNLDIDLKAAESVDFIVGAIHRVPSQDGFMRSDELALRQEVALQNWMTSVSSMLKNPAVDVWAHPGRLLLMNGVAIPAATSDDLASIAASSGKFAELTVSAPEHLRIPSRVFEKNGVLVIPASDCHRIADMRSYPSMEISTHAAAREFLSRIESRTR
jgi:putative hydrolase